jgi:hypothetical protein
MQQTSILTWTGFLFFGNLILSSAIVIIAFSLLTYILSHNFTSNVARAFGALLGCVMITYAGDVVVALLDELPAAIPWLRFQWVGIAFLPAVYLHFADAVLRTTNARSQLRRWAVAVAYGASLIIAALGLFTELIVRDGIEAERIVRLLPGPLFAVFAIYYVLAAAGGGVNIVRARQRCLTPTSIRRMTYLGVAYIIPAVGIFPYLLATSSAQTVPASTVLLLATIANAGVAVMLIVMGYSVAYFGVLSPDRVVKHSLIHFLLRGPFVGICVIVAMLIIPRVEHILGLPRDTVLIFAVMGLTVLLEVAIEVLMPFIDRWIYRQDGDEIAWLEELDKRILTTTDLKQFLENLLTALCELLRVRTGFIASAAGGKWQMEAATGDAEANETYLATRDLSAIARAPAEGEVRRLGAGLAEFRRQDGFWLLPLRTRSRDAVLGVLALKADSAEYDLSEPASEAVEALIAQAEIALEDRHLQQGVFAVLRKIIPEIERIQRWRGTVRYSAGDTLEMIEDSPVYAPEYQRWVKDALTHYWGGPRLTDSPLLKLRVVARKLQGREGSAANALRETLAEAIEALRPAGPRHMTASEWLLYNILEMRYIQGRRVREIADALAMSESDLYRKQRVALEEVARALANMEHVEQASQNGAK